MQTDTLIKTTGNREYKIVWHKVILYSIIISAFLPKILITEGINIYLPEIFMFFGILLFDLKQFLFFREQRLLLIIFFLIFIFSLLAQFFVSDVGSIMRSIKELLYIQIIYWATLIKDKEKFLKNLVWFGTIAYITNIFFFLSSFSVDNTIWSGAETLSSGMSNRAFDFTSFKIVQLSGLSHGIWGSYCILIFILAIELNTRKLIKKRLFVLVAILFFINMVISVSREAISILLIILLLYIFLGRKSLSNKILIVFGIVLTIMLLVTFGSNLPIIQKINYTIEALSSSGSESNVQIRINTWTAYFNFITSNIQYFFIGLGISPDNFYNHVSGYTNKDFVKVPESAVVYVQAYGGMFALIAFLLFLFTCVKNIRKVHNGYKLIFYFFLGIAFTNLFSGVSMFSDLLYAHLCLIYGLLVLNKQIPTK